MSNDFKEKFKVGDLITHQGLIDANFEPSVIQLIGLEKFAVIDSIGEINTYYINSHEWIKIEKSNNKNTTIYGESSLSVETVWEHFTIMNGDVIPQKLFEIRANGDIFWMDNKVTSNKELAHCLEELASGTMESRQLVKELTSANVKLLNEINELKNKLRTIKSIVDNGNQ